MIELWKEINDAPEFQISNLGRVKTPHRTSKWGRATKVHPSRIIEYDDTVSKYQQLDIRVNGKRYREYVHRLVAQYFIPNPENKPEVNHIDGNKSNNRFDNLEWVTHKENCHHAFNTGLSPKGEKHGRSKITREIVNEVKYLHSKGLSQRKVAKIVGISQPSVWGILNGKIWIDKLERTR